MELLLWIVLAAAAAGLEVWRRRRAKARMRAVRAWAQQVGMRYEYVDVSGLIDPSSQRLWRPFRLFGLGDRRGIENIVSGEIDGVHIELFDYWYEVDQDRHRSGGLALGGSTRSSGWVLGFPLGGSARSSRRRPSASSLGRFWGSSTGRVGTARAARRYRFTCAVANAPGAAGWPHLSIAPEGFARKLKAAAGFRDIEFESEEFNRTFEVQATDRKFAYDVIDARMMSWLLLTKGEYEFELRDQDLLLVADQLPVERWHQLALVAAGLVKRLPSTAVRRPRHASARPDAPPVVPPPERPADDYGFFA